MRAVCAVAVVFTTTILSAQPARAYCVYDPSGATTSAVWKDQPVTYRISSNLTDGDTRAAIAAAFAAWSGVNCSTLVLNAGSDFPITDNFEHGAKEIRVYWVTDQANWVSGVSTDYFAYTFIGHDNDGGLVQASIAINDFNHGSFEWATDGSGTKLDVKTQLLGLIGQVIGLRTSDVADAQTVIKEQPIFCCETDLLADDLDALHHLYNDTGCPAPPPPGASCGGGIAGDGGGTTTDGGGTTTDSGGTTTDGGGTTTDGGGVATDSSSSSDSFIPGGDSGSTACTSSDQCPEGQFCTAEGQCQGTGDDGCCAVAFGAPPEQSLLIALIVLGVFVGTRRRGKSRGNPAP